MEDTPKWTPEGGVRAEAVYDPETRVTRYLVWGPNCQAEESLRDEDLFADQTGPDRAMRQALTAVLEGEAMATGLGGVALLLMRRAEGPP